MGRSRRRSEGEFAGGFHSSARVLAVTDEEHLSDRIVVLPANAGDLVLPQSGRYRETHDATDGNDLLWVALERRDYAIDLGSRGPAVPLVSLADEPQAPKRDARLIYSLGTDDGPVTAAACVRTVLI